MKGDSLLNLKGIHVHSVAKGPGDWKCNVHEIWRVVNYGFRSLNQAHVYTEKKCLGVYSNHAEYYKLLLLQYMMALLLLLAADIMKALPAEPAFIIHEAYYYDDRPEAICRMLNTQIILQIYIFRQQIICSWNPLRDLWMNSHEKKMMHMYDDLPKLYKLITDELQNLVQWSP